MLSFTLRLTIGSGGREYGVSHACKSNVFLCEVYVTPSTAAPRELFVVDTDLGTIVDTIPLPEDFLPQFIYQTPDGRLIVTGGASGKIAIIDPS